MEDLRARGELVRNDEVVTGPRDEVVVDRHDGLGRQANGIREVDREVRGTRGCRR